MLEPFESKSLDKGNTFFWYFWSLPDRLKPFSVGVSIQNLKIKRDNHNNPFHYRYLENLRLRLIWSTKLSRIATAKECDWEYMEKIWDKNIVVWWKVSLQIWLMLQKPLCGNQINLAILNCLKPEISKFNFKVPLKHYRLQVMWFSTCNSDK